MIVGIGLDLVELPRIKKIYSRFGLLFAARILTPEEIAAGALSGKAEAANEVRFLASRFAAKEAASKALGTGLAQGVTLHCIEVVRQKDGRPKIVFTNGALDRANSLSVTHGHLSITHERNMAAATVILECRTP